jgi:hypothetical protein
MDRTAVRPTQFGLFFSNKSDEPFREDKERNDDFYRAYDSTEVRDNKVKLKKGSSRSPFIITVKDESLRVFTFFGGLARDLRHCSGRHADLRENHSLQYYPRCDNCT